ncbi:MAG: hypothetical protein R3225_01710 [Halofilum sp. (in: g-proteobacteria)]|nr:hypothetical protein [Halofilum sp. (in: g-proteobacteria)]
MGSSDREWYVRRGSSVQGPYSLDQMHRHLMLGRVRLTDRVSEDGQRWVRVTQCPFLIPEGMRDLGTEEGLARYEEARRAIDEREPEEDAKLRVGGERAVDPIPTTGGGSRLQQVVLPLLLIAVAILLTAMWLYQG